MKTTTHYQIPALPGGLHDAYRAFCKDAPNLSKKVSFNAFLMGFYKNHRENNK